VEGCEEVGGHGATVGDEGLVFDWTNFDDAGVVDEDVDAAEVGDGVFDEVGGLGWIGEVGWDEEDIVSGLDGVALEKGVAGSGEFVHVAGGEDESGSGATIALGEGKAKASGAAGDEDDLILLVSLYRARYEGVGGGGGGDAGEYLSGAKSCGGLLHDYAGPISMLIMEIVSTIHFGRGMLHVQDCIGRK
jgi:hypothetical protein